MNSEAEGSAPRTIRRALISQIAAARFSVSVLASILAHGAWSRGASPAPEAPTALPRLTSPFTTIPPGPTPADTLKALGIDQPLIHHSDFNFGTPPELITGFNVANDAFFLRSHGDSARLENLSKYTLTVGGHVKQPLLLTLNDLMGMPTRTISSILVCAGNGRAYIEPAVSGNQWHNDAVGNAEWTGVPLRLVLDKAGVKDGAVDVVSQGGDAPEMQRGLPIDVAMGADTLLVTKMNGEELPAPHGGPVRLLVPGWSGIASTKWLIGLTVLNHAFQGELNIDQYVIFDEQGTPIRAVQAMPVSSAIWAPAPGAALKAGMVEITGYAWSGLGAITRVEVSTDDGATWHDAQIIERRGEHSWAQFQYTWEAKPGPTVLQTRATDDRGTSQPMRETWNQLGYQYNGIQRVPVNVSA